MLKKKWWKVLITILTFGAKRFADGTLGSGKKTAKAGKVAGEALDAANKELGK